MIDYAEVVRQLEMEIVAMDARRCAMEACIAGLRSVIAHPEPEARSLPEGADGYRHPTATSPENEKSAPEERSTQTIVITEVTDDDQ